MLSIYIASQNIIRIYNFSLANPPFLRHIIYRKYGHCKAVWAKIKARKVTDGMGWKKEVIVTKQTQSIQPLLKWVNLLFNKLSTISYELFLQNKAKFIQSDHEKRNEPKLLSRTDTVLAQPAPLVWGAGKTESRKYKTNPFWTNEPILKNNHYAVTSDMETAYDQQTSIGYPKNEPKTNPFM
jgi:hypothetical protein